MAARLHVVSVGCGEPKKSMGWFHLTQLASNPAVELFAVVEPWFLGAGANAPGVAAFEELRASFKQTHPKCKFVSTVAEIDDLPEGPVMGLIAGRTADAPRFFEELCAKGVSHIYLEKPGAESAARLDAMRQMAAERDIPVVVGYNKNVAEYVRLALGVLSEGHAAGKEAPLVTLEHCNAFAPGKELIDFVSGAGAEGMLHNMACHELALAATIFGVVPERIASLVLHPEASEHLALANGGADWSRVSFTLELHPSDAAVPAGLPPTRLKFALDRCGGNFSCVHLGEAESFRLPSAARPRTSRKVEHQAWVDEEAAKDPEIRPYFLQQAPDYEALKAAFLNHIVSGQPGTPVGVVDIQGAVAALRLADMLKPALQQCWEAGAPWVWTPAA